MPLLSCSGILQNGQLRRGQELRQYVSPSFPCPSDHTDVAKGRLLEKEPSNLQAQSLNSLIEEQATRGELPSGVLGNSLTHSLRWIHRYGYRRRRRSRWCVAAHELSKAGSAQIISTHNRSSNAVAFVMLSRRSRTECLSHERFRLLNVRPPITQNLVWLRYSAINLFSHHTRDVFVSSKIR